MLFLLWSLACWTASNRAGTIYGPRAITLGTAICAIAVALVGATIHAQSAWIIKLGALATAAAERSRSPFPVGCWSKFYPREAMALIERERESTLSRLVFSPFLSVSCVSGSLYALCSSLRVCRKSLLMLHPICIYIHSKKVYVCVCVLSRRGSLKFYILFVVVLKAL